MSVEITPELESLVRTIFQGGNYRNENEVLDEALRLLEKREQLRRDVKAGVRQLDEGRTIPGEEVFEHLESKAQTIERRSTTTDE